MIPGKLLNDDRNQSEGIRSLSANIYESIEFRCLYKDTGLLEGDNTVNTMVTRPSALDSHSTCSLHLCDMAPSPTRFNIIYRI